MVGRRRLCLKIVVRLLEKFVETELNRRADDVKRTADGVGVVGAFVIVIGSVTVEEV